MSRRVVPVVKREFLEFVRTKTFILGTLLGPVFIAVLMVAPAYLINRPSTGTRTVAVVDATGEELGPRIAAALPAPAEDGDQAVEGRRYRTEVLTHLATLEAARESLGPRIERQDLDGFLFLPPGTVGGEAVIYEGRNATNLTDISNLESAVESAVRQERMDRSGVDPATMSSVFAPIPFQERKWGAEEEGGAEFMLAVAYVMGFALYLVVIMYGQAVVRGVMEEKRDRIVEIVVSSIRATDLMLGKVAGIGAAGVLQLLVWVGFAVAAILLAPDLMGRLGVPDFDVPAIPAALGVAFIFYFFAGYFLYASVFAGAASMATTDQEAQQLQMPVMFLWIGSFLLSFGVMKDPESGLAVAGSLIPFSSPMAMPARMALTDVPPIEVAASIAALLLTTLLVTWVAGKIYRIGILATGTKPTFREVLRWVRTG